VPVLIRGRGPLDPRSAIPRAKGVRAGDAVSISNRSRRRILIEVLGYLEFTYSMLCRKGYPGANHDARDAKATLLDLVSVGVCACGFGIPQSVDSVTYGRWVAH
jgi:hypothetical protein